MKLPEMLVPILVLEPVPVAEPKQPPWTTAFENLDEGTVFRLAAPTPGSSGAEPGAMFIKRREGTLNARWVRSAVESREGSPCYIHGADLCEVVA